MHRPFVPHTEPPAEVIYRNSKPLTKNKQHDARGVAIEQGMSLIYWGTKNQCWVIPKDAKLYSGIPDPADIYAIIGSNYVKVVDMCPDMFIDEERGENELPQRQRDRSGLAMALKKALE